ncbi:MAG: GAF domain-containing protein [Candidatus Omnitrophica bacterium]|nr:GAF domain-containing protein [Candidatus Omnitrophota bacterium]
MKIANKIRLVFFAASILVIAVSASIIYWNFSGALTKSISTNLKANLHARKNHIETYFRMLKSSVVQASKSVVLPKLLKMAKDDPGYNDAVLNANKLLKNKKSADDLVYEYMLLDSSGRIVASSDESSLGQDKSTDAYFLGGQKGVFIKDAYFSVTKKQPLMAVSVPLFEESRDVLLGVLVARIKLDDLNNIITDTTGLGETGEIYIINKYGYMITPSRYLKDTFLKQKVDTQNARLALERKDAQGLNASMDIFSDYRGVKVLGSYEYLPENHWIILAEMNTREAFAPLVMLQWIFFWVLLITLSTVWGVYGYIVKNISEPLQKLSKGAEVVGGGNLDYKVAISTRDEVGQLSRAFDIMTSNLKKTTASITLLNNEIEARKKIEKALDESERRFFDVFYASKDAVLLISENTFVDANETATRMLGYPTREEFVKTHPSELSPPIQPDGRSSVEKADEMIRLAYEKGFHQFEWMHRKASGEDFPVQVSLTPVSVKGKQILYCVWLDLTKQKQDERRLIETQERLKEQAQKLEETLEESRKSHEILSSMLDDNNEMRARFEQAARKLESILSSTGEGIFGLDIKGRHTFVNAQALKMLGYIEEEEEEEEEEEFIGKDSHSLWHHSHPDGTPYLDAECPNYKTLQDGQARHGEEYYWRKDGTCFPVEFSSVPLIENEKIIGIVVSFRDITERKRSAELLQVRMRLVQSVGQHPLNEFLQLSLDEIEKISESKISFYHFIEADQKNISLQAWSTRTKKDFCTAAGEGSHYSMDKAGVWVDCVREGKPVIHNDYKSLPNKRGMPEGHAEVVRELVVPIFREGKVVAILGVGNKPKDYDQDDIGRLSYLADIVWELTSKKLSEENMEQMKIKLVQTDKLATLGEMATGLAHEINQPLGGISLVVTTFKKFMQKKVLTEATLEEGIKDIEACITRMTKTIQHIRAFARQEIRPSQHVDLAETIDSALLLLGEQLRLHEVEVVKNIPLDLPRPLGEPHQLEQVWINMITNARDAMDDKQEQISQGKVALAGYQKKLVISVAHQKEINSIVASFTDNGMGVSEEIRKKVFEPFFTTKEVGKGTGLGLSISYGIINNHKGKIDMDSTLGEGTTIKITLPLEEAV